MTAFELFLLMMAVAFVLPVAMLIVNMRFGTVNRPWIRVSAPERAELKRLKALWAASHPAAKRQGKPLYRKGTFGRNGLAIYSNGVFAVFQLGPKGKYRFVPFNELSGLYPGAIRNLLPGTLSIIAGDLGKKQLQIETASGLAFVTQYSHPLEVIVPILQNSLGARWAELYHGDDPIDLGMGSGQMHIHKVIRASRPPPFVAGVGVLPPLPMVVAPSITPAAAAATPNAGAETVASAPAVRIVDNAPLGPMTVKGALLIEEPPESVERRRGQWLKAGIACIALGAGLVVVGYVLSGAVGGRSIFLSAMWLMIGPLIAALGGVLLYGSRSHDPIRFMENGLEMRNPVTKKLFFFSWGDIQFAMLRTMTNGQSSYMFRSTRGTYPFSVPADIPGLSALMEAVRPRIANPAFKVVLPEEPGERRKVRAVELGMYAFLAVLGAGLGWFMATPFSFLLSPSQAPFGTWILMAPMAAILVVFGVSRMKANQLFFKNGPDVRIPAAIIAVLLVVSLIAGSLAGGATPGVEPEVPLHIGPFPAASALAPGIYESQTMTVNGSILVGAGQTLEFWNSTVSMNAAFTAEFGIFVAVGGTLVVNNTTLRPAGAQNYSFEILGTATISQSIIWGLWGDRNNVDDDGGIEVYSSDVVIRNSLLQGGNSNTILVRNASPLIEGNTIMGARDDCVEFHNSTARLLNNTIRDCSYAVYVHDASPEVRGNLIGYNGHGMTVRGGAPVIEGNTFTQNRNFAIYYLEGPSAPAIGTNAFTSASDDVESGTEGFTLVPGLMGFSATVCGLALFGLWRIGRSVKHANTEAKADKGLLPIELR